MMQERLTTLIAEILDMPATQVREDMLRSKTPTWDSLNHLRMVTAIEEEFGASFTMDEISRIQTPAEIQKIIESRAAKMRQ